MCIGMKQICAGDGASGARFVLSNMKQRFCFAVILNEWERIIPQHNVKPEIMSQALTSSSYRICFLVWYKTLFYIQTKTMTSNNPKYNAVHTIFLLLVMNLPRFFKISFAYFAKCYNEQLHAFVTESGSISAPMYVRWTKSCCPASTTFQRVVVGWLCIENKSPLSFSQSF